MAPVTRWNGTDEDLRKLQDAVNHNCECKDNQSACPAHRMLLDQKVMDKLVFLAAIRRRLYHEEFDPRSEWGF